MTISKKTTTNTNKIINKNINNNKIKDSPNNKINSNSLICKNSLKEYF